MNNMSLCVLQNCHLDQDSVTDPSSLTSIKTLKSITNQSTILPQLQRISQLNDAMSLNMGSLIPLPNISLPKLPVPSEMHMPPQNENKSLVGSVTTWFPPSSTIQVGNNELNSESDSTRAPRPQFVEFIGNKKFLIVPKHNVLSVLPNSTFNKPEENVSTPDSAKHTTDITPNIPQTLDSAKLERNLMSADKTDSSVETNLANMMPQEPTPDVVKNQEPLISANEEIAQKPAERPE